jgi:hypothetical protein
MGVYWQGLERGESFKGGGNRLPKKETAKPLVPSNCYFGSCSCVEMRKGAAWDKLIHHHNPKAFQNKLHKRTTIESYK